MALGSAAVDDTMGRLLLVGRHWQEWVPWMANLIKAGALLPW